MTGIRARTIKRVQAMVNRYLTDSCTLLKQGDAKGTHNEPLNDWVVTASGVSCRVIRAGQQMNGSNALTGGRETLVDKHRLILPVGTTVAGEYRVEMADGRRYEVVDVMDDMTDSAYVQVIIKRLREKNG
jgi:head-tail adaptor